MSKIHVFLSFVVVLLVATISTIIELPIKIASFTILAVIYLLALPVAPLAASLVSKAHWTFDKLIDYAFSFKFVFVTFMTKKYIDALGM